MKQSSGNGEKFIQGKELNIPESVEKGEQKTLKRMSLRPSRSVLRMKSCKPMTVLPYWARDNKKS